MKMMSWSRYHALSWLVVRVRVRPCHRGVKGMRHPAKAVVRAVVMVAPETSAEGSGKGGAKRGGRALTGRLARALRSIIEIFRTRVLPGETDI
jgi:hypothetical protein